MSDPPSVMDVWIRNIWKEPECETMTKLPQSSLYMYLPPSPFHPHTLTQTEVCSRSAERAQVSFCAVFFGGGGVEARAGRGLTWAEMGAEGEAGAEQNRGHGDQQNQHLHVRCRRTERRANRESLDRCSLNPPAGTGTA